MFWFWAKCFWLHALKVCYNKFYLYFFFTQSKKGIGICEPCQDTIETNGLKLLHNVKTHWILIFSSLKRVRGIHVTCCKDVHGCTKEQASLGEFGSSMWFQIGLALPWIVLNFPYDVAIATWKEVCIKIYRVHSLNYCTFFLEVATCILWGQILLLRHCIFKNRNASQDVWFLYALCWCR